MVGASIDRMAADAVTLCRLVEELHPDTPWFLHGRSMGGLIALIATLDIQDSPNFKGSIFCAPAVRINGKGLVPPPCADWPPFRFLTNLVSGGEALRGTSRSTTLMRHDTHTFQRLSSLNYSITLRSASSLINHSTSYRSTKLSYRCPVF